MTESELITALAKQLVTKAQEEAAGEQYDHEDDLGYLLSKQLEYTMDELGHQVTQLAGVELP